MKRAVWVLPRTLKPIITFVAKNDMNGVVTRPSEAQTFNDIEDALDEQTESNKFRRPDEQLRLRPMLVVI